MIRGLDGQWLSSGHGRHLCLWSRNSIPQILLPEYKSDHARLQGAAGLILSGLDLAQLSCLSQEIHTEELIALNVLYLTSVSANKQTFNNSVHVLSWTRARLLLFCFNTVFLKPSHPFQAPHHSVSPWKINTPAQRGTMLLLLECSGKPNTRRCISKQICLRKAQCVREESP